MSESNLTEKITDTLNNIFKKSKIFEKLDKIQFYIGTFIFFSSMIGITSITINYINMNKIIQNEKTIKKNMSNIEEKIDNLKINEKINKLNLKIDDMENKIIFLLDKQKESLDEIKNLPLLNILKKDSISRSTSISSILDDLSPKKKFDETEVFNSNIIENENNKDDELIDDCYDIIPLNNSKKVTGFKSWLF